MTFALVILNKGAPRTPWPPEMYSVIHELPTGAGVTRLSEGAWLLDLGTELSTLGRIVSEAGRYDLALNALFFDQKPSFSTLEAAQKA